MASGLLVGSALAIPANHHVTGANPSAANNTASANVKITGTGFIAAQDESVIFHPTFSGTEVADIEAEVDSPQADTNNLDVIVPLSLAAPGLYDITVYQQDIGATTTTPSTCFACFTVTSNGPANATGVVFGPTPGITYVPPAKARGAGSLNISGTNFAKGATVSILNVDGTPDPNVSFAVNNPNPSTAPTGYPSSTLLYGNYTASAGFVPGRHLIRVTNTDGKIGDTTDFYLPFFPVGAVTPNQKGAGSKNTLVTLTGQGFRAGSTMSIQDYDTTSGCSDVQVGNSTVSADGTAISALVSLERISGCSAVSTLGRSVTITGPDGASYSRPNEFTAIAPPSVNAPNIKIGRGATFNVSLTGSGFVSGPNPPATSSVFSFGGGGVTAATQSVSSGGSAVISLSATADAVLGGRSITVTNPDGGAATTGPTFTGLYPVVVGPAPISTDVSPSSGGRGANKNITIKGTNFDDTVGMTVTFSNPGISTGNVSITKGMNGALDRADFVATISPSAAFGLSDVTLRNSHDGGTSSCIGCFGVDSLAVSPSADSNVGPTTITVTGGGLSSNSDIYLTRVGGNTTQPDIHGTNLTLSPTGQSATASYDISNAAPGKYNVLAVTAGSTLSCSACFSITGRQPTFTAINPAEAGQGALDVPVTLTGTNFSRGQQITIAGATVHDVGFVSTNQITGLVDVATATATGAKDVIVTNADGAYSATLSAAFEVTAGPTLKTITPAAVGQGAIAVTPVTLTGPGFVTGADGEPSSTIDLGPGITVSDVVVTQGASSVTNTNPDDTVTATIAVSATAATGLRNVRVINPDGGGSILSGKFTVNLGPKVTLVSPSVLRRGATDQAITITGSNFAADALPTIAGVEFAEELEVSEDGTTIVVNGTVSSTATRGARNATVLNPGDKGFGICSACFTIADVPSAPTVTQVTQGDSSAVVTWAAPADNGGTPITGYVVGAGNSIATVPATANETSKTITGLTPGVSYTFSVIAQNAQGNSLPGTRTATAEGKPSAPATVSPAAGDTKVTVSFSAASANGKPIIDYTVQASDDSLPAVIVPGTQTFAVITGLTNGTAYSFKVRARNDYGTGAFSALSATVVPKFATKLTSVRSPATGTSGSAVTYSGKLTRVTGAVPLVAVVVSVKLTPDIGNSRIVNAVTNSSGVWSFRFAPTYNTTVRATYAGDADDAAATATAYKMGVAPRISRSAPASGASSPASSTLAVKGSISPNKVGRTIGLYSGTRLVARGTVASNGSFTINVRLARGTYTLHVGIGATPGNVAGNSANFIVRRT